ncbi:MAG: tyrosine-type recombinase/integrase, partial [Spirochaetaceae bacterium]|nr:tyrosine-type recombinase/integrase [Spirochaetaceae bacterium]
MRKPYIVFHQKNSPYWYYRFSYEKTGHTTGCQDKDDANDFVLRLITGDTRSRPSDVLGQFAGDMFEWGRCKWIERETQKGRSFEKGNAKNRRAFLTNHIIPKFGARSISTISADEIEEWLVSLDLSNSTRNQILFTFRIVLDEALRKGIVRINVGRTIRQFASDSKERSPFTVSELNKLFPKRAVDMEATWGNIHVAVMAYVSTVTGARHSELRALQWRDILTSGDEAAIIISKTVRFDGSIGPPKNRKNRIAPLNPMAVQLLSILHGRQPSISSELFIFSLNGKAPYWTNFTNKYLNKALNSIDIDREGRSLVFHSFRHTFVTLMRRRNLNEEILQAIVGHQSKKVTDLYDHRGQQDLLDMLQPYRDAICTAFDFERILNDD